MSENHENLCEQVEMYVLGGLSERETAEFEEHLQSCVKCQEQVNELQELVGELPLTSEPVDPPEGMRSRVLKNVLSEHQDEHQEQANPTRISRSPIGYRIWGIASTAAAVFFGVFAYQMFDQQQTLHEQLASANAEIQEAESNLAMMEQELQQTAALLEEPLQIEELVELDALSEELTADGGAAIVQDARGSHLLVQTENMPELQGSEAFQVWLIEGEEQPVSAGTFSTDNNQGSLHFNFEDIPFDTVAITQEPDAEGTEPRGDMILASELNENDG